MSRAMAFRSCNMARQLDGLPPVKQNDHSFQCFLDMTEPLIQNEDPMAEAFSEQKLNASERQRTLL